MPETYELRLPYLRAYQCEPMRVSTRDTLVVSAPQIGKTYAAAAWLLASMWKYGAGEPYWWGSPTYAQTKHGLITYMANMAQRAGILKRKKDSAPQEVEIINDAVALGRSWEREGGLYGPPMRRGVVDEFSQLTNEAYPALSSRRAETLTKDAGEMLWIGNVGEPGCVAEDLWRQAISGAPGFTAYRWTWRDRALEHDCICGLGVELDEIHREDCTRGVYIAFLRTERSRMGQAQFKALYEAEWLDWNAFPVYYAFGRAWNVDAERAQYVEHLPIDLACDFNVDPMVWVIGHTKGRQAWVFDEIAVEGSGSTETAVKVFIERYQGKAEMVRLFGDATGKARDTRSKLSDYDIIETLLKGAGFAVQSFVPLANPPVNLRVNSFNAMLKSADGTVSWRCHPRCEKLINDLVRVSYRSGTKDIDKRNKKLTHASDAEGYREVELFPCESSQDAPVIVHSKERDRVPHGISQRRF